MIDACESRITDLFGNINATTPLGRMGEPSEVMEAAAWLLSD